jgi:hypothetical protein
MRSKGRTITVAEEGSEELRYLDYMRANASVGGGLLNDILLRPAPRVIEVWEEFLHGTQRKCGLIKEFPNPAYEIHVKRFMVRHHRLIGISVEDIAVLDSWLVDHCDG